MNPSKILVSQESAWLTESVPSFWNRKIAHIKKLCRCLIPEFNQIFNRFASKALLSIGNLPQKRKESDINSSDTNLRLSSNEDDLQSIFEPIAIKLIDEFFGFKELKSSFTERTLHLANEYKIEKKKWDLENNLEVLLLYRL